MTTSPPALTEIRTNNLALAFQEVFTVILRTRFFQQRVENADAFRATLRKMISGSVKDCSTMGYSDEASKMAIYAMIGFLDESVLNSKDPTFADWSRRPLQEEMFGGHFAGEYFFRNVTDLLNRPESAEVADVLELHALCLLLGYRGRFAFGDTGEIHTILSRIREKIARIRGNYVLFRPVETPSAPPAPKRDPWVGRLAWTAVLLAVVTVLAYVGYILVLGQAVPTTASLIAPTSSASGRVWATARTLTQIQHRRVRASARTFSQVEPPWALAPEGNPHGLYIATGKNSQGTTPQPAETLLAKATNHPDTTPQPTETLLGKGTKCQGMTSVVPQAHPESEWASAPRTATLSFENQTPERTSL